MRPLSRRAVLAGAALLAARASWAGEAVVAIDNFAFAPADLAVAVGTRVTWTNRDDTPHMVASAARPPLFRSPPLDTGDGYVRVFDTAGTFRYFCALHPHMQGVVVVT